MDKMLSQEEINALLNKTDEIKAAAGELDIGDYLTAEEIDAVGEISNISMGTAATTLNSLVNQKVNITTPVVSVTSVDILRKSYKEPFVTIEIYYKEGLDGTNFLILDEKDVKVITDLMMGGDGTNFEGELSELHLSAIGEAMNQMIGSSATSMSSMFNKKVDIEPPMSNRVASESDISLDNVEGFADGGIISVTFNLQIGDLVDSKMVQLYPIEFAKELYDEFIHNVEKDIKKELPGKSERTATSNATAAGTAESQPPTQNSGSTGVEPPIRAMARDETPRESARINPNVEVQEAQFQNFTVESLLQQKENIDLIMDVQLEVTVELGRTKKTINEILEFSPGSIIELNKLSGEPIDVLVNGKVVAKGEVVVIDENFSIRITEINKSKVNTR